METQALPPNLRGPQRTFGLTFLLVLAIIAARNWPALGRAEFWAEDGTDFFSCSIEVGTRCLWTPVTGYHLFLSRLIAWAAGVLPVVAAPFVYATTSWLINGLVCSFVVLPRYAWLVPRSLDRVGIAILFALAPGSAEAYLNLANIQQSLTLLAFLLLLGRPATLSRGELGLLTIIFFSTGTAILIAPLLLLRFARTRDRSFAWALGLLALSLALNVYSSQVSAADAPRYTDWTRMALAPRTFVAQFFIRLLLLPWLGVSATNSLIQSSDTVFYGVGGVGLAFALHLVVMARLPREAIRDLAVALLAGLAYYPMIVVFRDYARDAVLRPTSLVQWEGRYSFLVGCMALLFWIVVLTGVSRSEPRSRWIGVALCALVFLPPVLNSCKVPPRPDVHWPIVAARIQKAVNRRAKGRLREPCVVDGILLQPNGYLGIAVTIR